MSGEAYVHLSHGQSCSCDHFNASSCPYRAAVEHVLEFLGQLFALAQASSSPDAKNATSYDDTNSTARFKIRRRAKSLLIYILTSSFLHARRVILTSTAFMSGPFRAAASARATRSVGDISAAALVSLEYASREFATS